MRALVILPVMLLVASLGCTPEAFCGKRQECDRQLAADDQAVCVASYKADIDALRANSEPECHKLADAILALDACRASLSCDDFQEADLGQKCDDPSDSYRVALDQTRPNGISVCSTIH